MLSQLFNISRTTPFLIACSGGVDSMAVADFYKRGGKNFELAYFNHGTPQADQMESLVNKWAIFNEVKINVGKIKTTTKPKDLSPEEYWRNERYEWFHSVSNGRPIITCHHLNDVCEGWIFSSLNGNPKIIKSISISPKKDLIWRPFLTTPKQDMINWCIKNNISWFEDKSNEDISTPRNRIRHNIMSEGLKINPGLFKVMKKKVISEFSNNKSTFI